MQLLKHKNTELPHCRPEMHDSSSCLSNYLFSILVPSELCGDMVSYKNASIEVLMTHSQSP